MWTECKGPVERGMEKGLETGGRHWTTEKKKWVLEEMRGVEMLVLTKKQDASPTRERGKFWRYLRRGEESGENTSHKIDIIFPVNVKCSVESKVAHWRLRVRTTGGRGGHEESCSQGEGSENSMEGSQQKEGPLLGLVACV